MRCAVLGSPIAHSLSPALHRAAYEHLGLDWTYDAVLLEAVTAPREGSPVLTARLPDGRAAALAFTSSLEVEAVLPGSASAVRPLRAFLQRVLDDGRPGLVLDPAGPSATLTPADLRRVLGG